MKHVTSLIKLNILDFTPLCHICNIFGHTHIPCGFCGKMLCREYGLIFMETKSSRVICYNCRMSNDSSSFVLLF